MHMPHKLCLRVRAMLDLIERVVHDNFSLCPFNLHIWLNMSIFFSKESFTLGFVLRRRFGYFLFLFCFL
jgi:hypothetical protein